MFQWSVSYETATVVSGLAKSLEEARALAWAWHDKYVLDGLNPDKLAYHY